MTASPFCFLEPSRFSWYRSVEPFMMGTGARRAEAVAIETIEVDRKEPGLFWDGNHKASMISASFQQLL
jgi:hypothetical protein